MDNKLIQGLLLGTCLLLIFASLMTVAEFTAYKGDISTASVARPTDARPDVQPPAEPAGESPAGEPAAAPEGTPAAEPAATSDAVPSTGRSDEASGVTSSSRRAKPTTR